MGEEVAAARDHPPQVPTPTIIIRQIMHEMANQAVANATANGTVVNVPVNVPANATVNVLANERVRVASMTALRAKVTLVMAMPSRMVILSSSSSSMLSSNRLTGIKEVGQECGEYSLSA